MFDDGWDTLEEGLAQPREPLRTEVIWEDARSIISGNESPDVYFDRSINPYRGCEHGCIYCYARPTHSYLNMSPDSTSRPRSSPSATSPRCCARKWPGRATSPGSSPSARPRTATSPWSANLRLTRSVIELMHETRHAFSLVTKSSGVERDLDLIAPMAAMGLASVNVTITTLDADLTRKLEPRAAAPHRRLRILRTLAEHGVPCGVSLAPQIPFLTEDMEQVLEAAWDAGARSAFYHVLRLPWEVSRCSSSGWKCTTRSEPKESWRASTTCAAARTTTATSPRA
jgi:DNA repair photolyase